MLRDRCRPQSLLLAGVLLGISSSALATTYVVTNTNDSGAGSLRQAILDANANPGFDEITFAIAGSGVQVITPQMPLMIIDDPVLLDGYSQPGSSPNSAPPGSGFNSVIEIEIDGILELGVGSSTIRGISIGNLVLSGVGAGAGVSDSHLGVDASGTSVIGSGLSISNSTGVQIGPWNVIGYAMIGKNANGTVVRGNFVGLTPSGDQQLTAMGSCGGLGLSASTGVLIGGPDASARNVISCGGILGSEDSEFDSTTATIQGNYIGTDLTGTRALGPADGISSSGGPGSEQLTIVGNVIGSTFSSAIAFGAGSSGTVQGNFIGTDATGTLDLGSRDGAIRADGSGGIIGGVNPGEANVIAFNRSNGFFAGGISIGGGDWDVRGNVMFANEGMGIDLGDDGITLNDPGDADLGPNDLQNFPVITNVVRGASTTHIEGTLNSRPAVMTGPDTIDLYRTPACALRPRGYVEGRDYLGSVVVSTDSTGNASFATDVPAVLAADDVVTATTSPAFDGVPGDPGWSSEFMPRIVFDVSPPTGPGNQPVPVTLDGMLFEDGATVLVGNVPATNVSMTSPTTMSATMPAFPPGTVHDLVLSLASGPSSTLQNGWITDFTDVPPDDLFHDSVLRLVGNGIAAGVGGGLYGAASPTLREQMAVFLLKAEHGQCFAPASCTGMFDDVPCSSPFAPFIETLASEGITAGCGGNDFCPTDPVRRDQMAVFLLKTRHHPYFVPPPCTGAFPDVPCPSLFADWVEELAHEQITAGCGGGDYCPLADVTRAQMAAFVVKTFHLP